MSGFRRRARLVAFALAAALAGVGYANAAATDTFPEPPALAPAVAFWVRVYTEATTDGGFLHDAYLMDVVYQHIRFEGETRPRERERIVEHAKSQVRDMLDWLAGGGTPRDDHEQQVMRLFTVALGHAPTAGDLRDARDNVRFQLGQRDKFREGLVRSGAYESQMRAVFRDQGMPEDLALLPHVESSFNVRAYSKYGAAGVWQFMRGTGRRFMKVDYVVDERLDPITSTRAAARLLKENYSILGSWPLALTAYNHGAGGMARAVKRLGTDRIDEIVLRYDGRTFGFASRNFYTQFLAARKVIRNYESYFGPVQRDQPRAVEVVSLPFYADVSELQNKLGVSPAQIAELNPALRQPVFRSGKRIPRGYALRLPAGSTAGSGSRWVASVPAEMRHSDQRASRYYTVRRGDTLSEIASENRTTIAQLLAQNDLGKRQRIYPGQVLQLPDRPGTAPRRVVPPVAIAQATQPEPVADPTLPTPAPTAPAPPPTEVAVAVSQSLEKSPPPVEPATPPAEVVPAPPGETVAALEPAGMPPAPSPTPAQAAPPAPEPTAPSPAVPSESAPAQSAPPTVAEDEAPFSPSDLAGPEPKLRVTPEKPARATVALAEPAVTPAESAAAAAQKSDESPYRRVSRDRVIVDDDETLGHFADWLEVSPQKLRKLNKLKPRQPIHVGQTLKLDFAKVSPDELQQRRLEYHKGIEEDFFGSYRVTGTVEHSLRAGDTLWVLSHKLYGVPTWLIHRYNPDVDFAKLVPGVKLQIPVVEKLG
ncbi:MAG TPA: LysM peptidoglycan-binding domain-containing protein [Myxococcota bacterium]|nr:LysM peptidoglycan-binding domain-containing protein [Myxococcota bacterium]